MTFRIVLIAPTTLMIKTSGKDKVHFEKEDESRASGMFVKRKTLILNLK
jgi:hypothetical protein